MNSKVKALVLLAAGINCDGETALAFELAGAEADRIHVNDLIARPQLMRDYAILAIPGGFSFGDDIASGQVLARELKYRLAEPLRDFIDRGKLVLGICNGFQVLVKMGLLPAAATGSDVRPQTRGSAATFPGQQAALTFNSSARFEDRWVNLKVDPKSPCVFTKGIEELISVPVRNGEGRFIPESPESLARLKAGNQVVVRYVDPAGNPGGYPINPSGSVDDIAGVCDPSGRVFGLMPHPEVFVRTTQHPRWTRGEGRRPQGLSIFKNAVGFSLL
jgi:phosphoribosylformylglycinamidine synthase subunit PurQ / glutaminase